jgi:hypothetical protein
LIHLELHQPETAEGFKIMEGVNCVHKSLPARVNNGNTRKPQNLTETKAGKIGLLGGGIGSAWHEMRRLRTKMKSNHGRGSHRHNTASPRRGIESIDTVAVADIKI